PPPPSATRTAARSAGTSPAPAHSHDRAPAPGGVRARAGRRSGSEGVLMEFTIRDAHVRDWPGVAGLLVELGRDVPESATTNPSHVIHFGGHLARRECVTL